jgi:hypothetical protein
MDANVCSTTVCVNYASRDRRVSGLKYALSTNLVTFLYMQIYHEQLIA